MPAPTAATKDIVSMLKMDAKSPHPKYPSQSIYAAQDENVAKSLMHRFEQGAKLRGIRAFEFDLITGLNRLCFEFENAGPVLGGDDVLVLLDSNCAVVGLVDPFDSRQPNRRVPPLATIGGAMPFVLQRPSAATNLPFGAADLAPANLRAREFMTRMVEVGGGWGWGGGGFNGDDPCGPEAFTTTCTVYSDPFRSVVTLGTPWDHGISHMDYSMDNIADDCGI
jgi:hypothetical protein